MTTYRKKPVEVEAVLWTGENWPEILAFVAKSDEHSSRNKEVQFDSASHSLLVATSEGRMRCSAGEWLIREVKSGDFHPCRGDIFEETYEVVDVFESV